MIDNDTPIPRKNISLCQLASWLIERKCGGRLVVDQDMRDDSTALALVVIEDSEGDEVFSVHRGLGS